MFLQKSSLWHEIELHTSHGGQTTHLAGHSSGVNEVQFSSITCTWASGAPLSAPGPVQPKINIRQSKTAVILIVGIIFVKETMPEFLGQTILSGWWKEKN